MEKNNILLKAFGSIAAIADVVVIFGIFGIMLELYFFQFPFAVTIGVVMLREKSLSLFFKKILLCLLVLAIWGSEIYLNYDDFEFIAFIICCVALAFSFIIAWAVTQGEKSYESLPDDSYKNQNHNKKILKLEKFQIFTAKISSIVFVILIIAYKIFSIFFKL